MTNGALSEIAVIGIDIGKNTFHAIGLNQRGAIILRQKWSRRQVASRLSNLLPCLIGMEACVGGHHLARQCVALGHDARLMPAKYVKPYSKGPNNDFRDAEAIDRPCARLPRRSTDRDEGKAAVEPGKAMCGLHDKRPFLSFFVR